MKLVPTIAAAFLSIGITAFGEPKPLSKSDAAKILESMGYKDVKVAFIIQGLMPVYGPGGLMAGSQDSATVTGVAILNSAATKVERRFFYDNDLGWFCTEDLSKEKGIGIRIWSLAGYSEVNPPPKK